jgi:hypothetical protein
MEMFCIYLPLVQDVGDKVDKTPVALLVKQADNSRLPDLQEQVGITEKSSSPNLHKPHSLKKMYLDFIKENMYECMMCTYVQRYNIHAPHPYASLAGIYEAQKQLTT